MLWKEKMREFKKGDRVMVNFSKVWGVRLLEKGVRSLHVGKVVGKTRFQGMIFYRVRNPEWEGGVRSFKALTLTKF